MMKVLECGFGFRLGLLEGFGFWCGNYKFYVLRSIDGKLTLMSSFDINEKYNGNYYRHFTTCMQHETYQ